MEKHKDIFIYYGSQFSVVLLIATLTLRLWDYDLRVPISYGGDSLVLLSFIKGMTLNGWTWSVPQLSAPFEFSASAFPIATSFDWMLMKIMSIFTGSLGIIANGFWILTIVFSAGFSSYSMRLINVNSHMAYAGGILYAFLPYALLRNVAHLNLVYYLVPLIATLTIHIASSLSVGGQHTKKLVVSGLIACAAQGFNYIYFSFFGIILLGFAGLLGYLKTRSLSPIKLAMVAISVIIGAATLNLAPTFYSWQKYGKPPETNYKNTAETEIYGAKLRKMIVPHADNRIPGFRYWAAKDQQAGFPNENENETVRLGLAGTIGFVLLLLISLGAIRLQVGENNNALYILAPLALISFLVITVGGLGATINTISVPDIRAYNRFSVFIAYFSITAIALLASASIPSTLPMWKKKLWPPIILLAILCVSLYDQLLDSSSLVVQQKMDAKRYNEDRNLVEKIVSAAPSGGSVFQLPLTGFPPLSLHEAMYSYDHLRPFLWAPANFKWSFPSFSIHHRSWQEKIQNLGGDELLDALAFSGFDMVWIDKSAYKDSAAELIGQLQNAGAIHLSGNSSDHVVVLGIKARNHKLLEKMGSDQFALNVKEWREALSLQWSDTFYTQETAPDGARFRWSGKSSSLSLINSSANDKSIHLSMTLGSQSEGIIYIKTSKSEAHVSLKNDPVTYEVDIPVVGNSREIITFNSTLPRVNAPNDNRKLYFYLKDFSAR
jgi:hypothetical protein